MAITKLRGNTQIIDGSIVNAQLNASAGVELSKLESVTDGNILIGNGSNVLAQVSTSGDVTLSNAGAFAIASGVIVNDDVNASAAIDFSKLATLTDGNLLIGNGSNVATSVSQSGDGSFTNAGVFAIASGVIVDDDINGSAAIALSKLAEAVIQADGGQAFTADQPMGSNKLTGLANGTAGTDAVNLNQLNAQTNDLDRKNGVQLVEIVNLTLSGEQTIDGTLTSASRVLLVGQTDESENGIYDTAAGAWARSSDADAPSEVTLGLMTTVEEGSARAGTVWLLTTVSAAPTVIDTTDLTFTELPSEAITASGFLDKTSGDITLKNLADGAMIVGNGSGVATSVTMSGDVTITNAGVAAIGSLVIVNADVNASAAIDYSKLAALTDGNILVGNGSNVATSVNPTGDIDISNTGVFSIASDVIVNADVNSSAAIDYSKLAALSDGNILVGNGSNVATSVNPSGDIDVSNTGVFSIASDVIVNDDVNSSAAIDFSKLATLTSANLLVGSAGNVATSVTMSGDATLSNAGVLSLASTVLKEADIVTREVPTGLINSSNTSYSLASTPIAGTEHVYLNGILQNVGGSNDYTISGATITYNTAPTTGDILLVSSWK